MCLFDEINEFLISSAVYFLDNFLFVILFKDVFCAALVRFYTRYHLFQRLDFLALNCFPNSLGNFFRSICSSEFYS